MRKPLKSPSEVLPSLAPAAPFRRLRAGVLLLLAPASLSATSLWLTPGGAEQNLVADLKASRVGDILTIVVLETTRLSASQNTTTAKNSSIDFTVSQFLYPPSADPWGTRGGNLPASGMEGGTSHTGGGSISNSQTLTTRFSVRVIDRLPNNQLVIEGVRVVFHSGERHFLVLTGVVRPVDIDRDNTIISSRIADARLEFLSEGTLTESQRKGWLTRVYDLVNPF